MAAIAQEQVTSVHHWTDSLFSFKTTRNAGLRFKNGHFVMIGLEVNSKPLLRAYSIASANYEDELEFYSIKVQDGPLTQHLQNIKPGDMVYVGSKPTGTLTLDNLLPGKNLYLLSTGTGLAPFLSIIRDPETYEQYDKVILTHGCRHVRELAYEDLIMNELPNHEYFGDEVQKKLIYYPTVTREPFRNQGRLTDLFESGKLFTDIGLPTPNVQDDRFMICGSPVFLKDIVTILDNNGFNETRGGELGQYAIERAFVEK